MSWKAWVTGECLSRVHPLVRAFLEHLHVLVCQSCRFFAVELEADLKTSSEAVGQLQTLVEAEASRTNMVQNAITQVCNSLGVTPEVEQPEDTPGYRYVRRLSAMADVIRERICAALHIGVKRALAVTRSEYLIDMTALQEGFITDEEQTAEENRAMLEGFVHEADVPGEKLAKLFEGEVLPPEIHYVEVDADEDDGDDGAPCRDE